MNNVKTFEFIVSDKNNEKSQGTIEAKDREEAINRLVNEYQFNIISLHDVSIKKNKKTLEEKINHSIIEENIKKEEEISINEDEVNQESKEILISYVKNIIDLINQIKSGFYKKMSDKDKNILRVKISSLNENIKNKEEDLLTYKYFTDDLLSNFYKILNQHSSYQVIEFSKIKAKHEKEVLEIIKSYKEDLMTINSNIQQDNKKIKNYISSEKIKIPNNIINLLKEVKLLIGWLLFSYSSYIYFSYLVVQKFEKTNYFYDFSQKSLSGNFPFMSIGTLFLLFLSISVAMKFSKNIVQLSIILFSGIIFITLFLLFF